VQASVSKIDRLGVISIAVQSTDGSERFDDLGRQVVVPFDTRRCTRAGLGREQKQLDD